MIEDTLVRHNAEINSLEHVASNGSEECWTVRIPDLSKSKSSVSVVLNDLVSCAEHSHDWSFVYRDFLCTD